MSAESMIVRHVEVRTWPERTDVLVIDQERAVALSHYDLGDIPAGAEADPVFDPLAGYQARARAALRGLERDQERLVLHFEVDPRMVVRLAPTAEPRASLAAILSAHGLSLDLVELPVIGDAIDHMRQMDELALWALLCDWYDRAERRYPPGTSRGAESSWAHRSHPDRAGQFNFLAEGDTELAYELFREQVDAPLAELRLHHVIAWVYYSRTEFAGREPEPLRALAELRTRS